MVDVGSAATPCLIQHHVVDHLGGHPVEQVDCHGDSFSPEHHRNASTLEQAPGHGDHGLVLPLDHAVLLRCVWCSVLPLHASLGTVCFELNRGELTPIVRPQHSQSAASLHLHHHLEFLQHGECITLGRQQRQPHEPAFVIKQEQEFLTVGGCWRGWSTQVTVDKVQQTLGMVLRMVVTQLVHS
jgi:hypothetical protein